MENLFTPFVCSAGDGDKVRSAFTGCTEDIAPIIQTSLMRQEHARSYPSSTDISLGYPGDGLTDELDVQCYVPWTSSDNPNVATYDIKHIFIYRCLAFLGNRTRTFLVAIECDTSTPR
ncbi:hypothetical protein DAPPUDRAFT_124792 [Daphnia pulex]|uniref:Uncharacterized protein n=1 Tax=Daphnia pulex TaxID=6669 RepID=E9I6W4_DAPPU|nr:hypothetical protein DAPPUDRAFT_124792 [Daphnia pulex]|eukprot:EFX60266.1 hypothetical protein DAPPUDRAFT_124792 [Daphnia pulex]